MAMTASEVAIFAMVRKRFPPDRYALIPQVPDATGGNKIRTADAVALGLWPSRGIELDGFEFKASRQDWVKELRDPGKAERVARYCHRWWVVVSDAKIVKDGELPSGWGLLAPRKDGVLVVKAQAPTREEPRPVGYSFLAGLLRAAVAIAPYQGEIDAAHERGLAAGRRGNTLESGWAQRNLDALKGKVDKFEKASGVDIGNAWNVGDIGKAVRTLTEGVDAVNGVSHQIRSLHDQAVRIAKRLKGEVDRLPCGNGKQLHLTDPP